MAELNKKDLTILGELMQSGKVTPVIDRTYPLSQIPTRFDISNKVTLEGK